MEIIFSLHLKPTVEYIFLVSLHLQLTWLTYAFHYVVLPKPVLYMRIP